MAKALSHEPARLSDYLAALQFNLIATKNSLELAREHMALQALEIKALEHDISNQENVWKILAQALYHLHKVNSDMKVIAEQLAPLLYEAGLTFQDLEPPAKNCS